LRANSDVLEQVSQLVAELNRDPTFVREAAEFGNTAVVLSATDTGRELLIVLATRGVRAGPYDGERFDVKIRATEDVHWAVLSGEMDADAAFFAGRIRICGPMLVAWRVKNRFLSLLQWHMARKSAQQSR
jgi:putative sterol carrier protein